MTRRRATVRSRIRTDGRVMSEGNIARTQPVGTVTPFLALVLALGCGLIAANLYYAQPLTGPIGATFAIRPAETGLLVTLTQH